MTEDSPQPQERFSLRTVRLTQIEVLNFLKSVGYEVPRACPKCSFDPWDEAFVTPDALAAEYKTIFPARATDANSLSFICPRCGYTETFNAAPLINWKLTQDE